MMFINVVVGVIEYNNKILLIKRNRGNFSGYWGLPGGKIEDGEHVDEAIIREIGEECNINVNFIELLGVFTEIIRSKGKTISTVIYGCKLGLKNVMPNNAVLIKNDFFSCSEGNRLKWFTSKEIERFESNIIHSDLMLLKKCMNCSQTKYMKINCYENDEGCYNWIEAAINYR